MPRLCNRIDAEARDSQQLTHSGSPGVMPCVGCSLNLRKARYLRSPEGEAE
jgi:hypothetical protein